RVNWRAKHDQRLQRLDANFAATIINVIEEGLQRDEEGVVLLVSPTPAEGKCHCFTDFPRLHVFVNVDELTRRVASRCADISQSRRRLKPHNSLCAVQ